MIPFLGSHGHRSNSHGYASISVVEYGVPFSILRNLHTNFHNSCTILHSHQQWIMVSLSPHLSQAFVVRFLNDTILGRYVKVALICIYSANKDVKCFLKYLAMYFLLRTVYLFYFVYFLVISCVSWCLVWAVLCKFWMLTPSLV